MAQFYFYNYNVSRMATCTVYSVKMICELVLMGRPRPRQGGDVLSGKYYNSKQSQAS